MNIKHNQMGISIIEILMAIIFTSIVAMAIAKSTIIAQRMAYKTDHRSVAMQLMIETLEQYGRINPETFSPSLNVTDQPIEKDGVNFKISLSFETNPDRSREVTVSIQDPIPLSGFTITQTGTYTLWGGR